MAETKTYTGGCHCGAVRYEVDAALEAVNSCNCSFCSKVGALWAFVPGSAFRLLSGEERLEDYQFNARRIHHLFCSTCGIRSFSRGNGPDGSEMIGLNVRCLDDVDLDGIPVKHIDGKSL